MKVNKMISLDIELVEKLKKEDNTSGLINNLLIDYYNGSNLAKLSVEQLTKLKAKRELLRKHKQELKDLNG